MSKFLEVINNTSSQIKLICTRGHIVLTEPHHTEIPYKKGEIHSRNCIYLNPAHWKICPKRLLPIKNTKTNEIQ